MSVLGWLAIDIDAAPPDAAGGPARTLLALRHALADPLSAATLKLNLVERRLMTSSGADPTWVADRVRAAQANVDVASRLLDLLVRLAEIAAQRPEETLLCDICRDAGVLLDEPAVVIPRLSVRRRASAEAVRSVASFAAGGEDATPSGRAGLEEGRASLRLEGSRVSADGRPARLLELPHGVADAEALFLARAAVEADGGRLELSELAGRLVAILSWPVAAEPKDAV